MEVFLFSSWLNPVVIGNFHDFLCFLLDMRGSSLMMVGFCMIFDRYMHSECECGHLWGIVIASRLDSNTSSITIFLSALFANFLLPSILAYIGIIIGVVNGFTNDDHCVDIMYLLRMFLGIIFGSSTWIVVCSLLSVSGDFVDELCWNLKLYVFLIFPMSHPYLVVFFIRVSSSYL